MLYAVALETVEWAKAPACFVAARGDKDTSCWVELEFRRIDFGDRTWETSHDC